MPGGGVSIFIMKSGGRGRGLTCCQYDLGLEGVFEHTRAPEINNLHDPKLINNDVIELKITMSKAHTVDKRNTTQDLQERARHLLARHLARHDDSEEIVRRILHNLVPLPLFPDDIKRLDDITMV